MSDAINCNVVGPLNVFKLAQRFDKLESFVHVSTAYVNCNRKGFIEEKIYPLDFDPEEMIQRLLSIDKKEVLLYL